MTTAIVVPEPEPTTDATVALIAGETAAEVEHLTEEVAEVAVAAEIAQGTAKVAMETATESVTGIAQLIEQNAIVMQRLDGITSALVLIAEALDEPDEPEPVPEPPKVKKTDTAPKRKSNTHQLLYGKQGRK